MKNEIKNPTLIQKIKVRTKKKKQKLETNKKIDQKRRFCLKRRITGEY
jgi:hypothetical protein